MSARRAGPATRKKNGGTVRSRRNSDCLNAAERRLLHNLFSSRQFSIFDQIAESLALG